MADILASISDANCEKFNFGKSYSVVDPDFELSRLFFLQSFRLFSHKIRGARALPLDPPLLFAIGFPYNHCNF